MRSGFILALVVSTVLAAAEPELGPGTHLDHWLVGTTTYRNVRIRSVTPHSVMITHDGGMTSIPLRDLSAEWQARFHYDPAKDVAVAAQAALPAQPPVHHPPAPPVKPPRDGGVFAGLMQSFGQPASIRAKTDLRPKFFQLELSVKNQGRRPSCAIFAVVCAMEFQNAELTGNPEKFSEEYLSWATRKTSQRVPITRDAPEASQQAREDEDEGFTLSEVVAALRGYGIPLQAAMPNTFGRALGSIEQPPPDVIEEARTHRQVFVHAIPGHDNATRINNLVHVLNAGIPVPIGIAWPNFRSLRAGYLAGQTPVPGEGHAVTLVGYSSSTGRLEDTVFVFKNSWGPNWGQGGYGTVTYGYLNQHLAEAIVLEVQAKHERS